MEDVKAPYWLQEEVTGDENCFSGDENCFSEDGSSRESTGDETGMGKGMSSDQNR